MRDLNFFESYIDKKDFKMNKQWILFSIVGLILIALLTKGVLNQMKISRLDNEVGQLKEIAENPATLEKVDAIKAQEDELNQFKEEVEKIRTLDGLINEENLINEDFLSRISSRLPMDAFMTNLSVSPQEINISGIAQDRWNIAEFSRGLEDLDEVGEVFISDIRRESDFYNFNVNLILKGVVEDGD